jgi:hypothetical protein
MGKRLSKIKKTDQKKKKQHRKIKRTESMDAKGIRKKKWNIVISYQTYFKMKVIGIILIPIVYFVYSPFLILVMGYYVSLYYFAILAERSMNKSIIKSRQIKLPKYDSGLAAFLIFISLFGSIFGLAQSGKIGRLSNTLWIKVGKSLETVGSLMTGLRVFFGTGRIIKFGMGNPPDGFVRKGGNMGDFDRTPRMGSGRPLVNLSLDNLPIEFMFSQILSTTATILIFSVMGMGIISLWMTHKKVNKFNKDIYEVYMSGEIKMLSDVVLNKIVDFGVV